MTGAPDADVSTSEVHRFALGKMTKVLGPERARVLLERLSKELGTTLDTPQDLLRFSDAMARMGGFEAAVGAMLGVAAVLRGASPAEAPRASNAAR